MNTIHNQCDVNDQNEWFIINIATIIDVFNIYHFISFSTLFSFTLFKITHLLKNENWKTSKQKRKKQEKWKRKRKEEMSESIKSSYINTVVVHHLLLLIIPYHQTRAVKESKSVASWYETSESVKKK